VPGRLDREVSLFFRKSSRFRFAVAVNAEQHDGDG
jgi:hypothetical protein